MGKKPSTFLTSLAYWPRMPRQLANKYVDELQKPDVTTDKLLTRYPTGRATACIWSSIRPSSNYPILVIDNAAAIAKHFKRWSKRCNYEFHLQYATIGTKFCLGLIPPRLEVMLDAQEALVENIIQPRTKLEVVFRPIHYIGVEPKNHIASQTPVFLLDSQHVNPPDYDISKAVMLGGFKAYKTDDAFDNMKQLLVGDLVCLMSDEIG